MKTFELNIGLLVGDDQDDPVAFALGNQWSDIKDRMHRLSCRMYVLGVCVSRFHAGEEPTLVVAGRVSTDDPGGFHKWLYLLAEEFGQDCLAIYYPDEENGYLLGPNADAWGEFDIKRFERY